LNYELKEGKKEIDVERREDVNEGRSWPGDSGNW